MLLNKQIPIKREESDGLTVLVHSIFYTIQGEGPFAGHPAIFVRLAGCNLQCPQCDTEYTEGAEKINIGEIISAIHHLRNVNQEIDAKPPIVVISGGEPMRQTIGPWVNQMLRLGFIVQIETNGTLFDHTINWQHVNIWVVCSPKAGKVNPKLHPYISAYKYVLDGHDMGEDGLPNHALGHEAIPRLARPHPEFIGQIFIQPVDVQDKKNNAFHLKAAVKSAMKNGYILCLQVHKIIGVP